MSPIAFSRSSWLRRISGGGCKRTGGLLGVVHDKVEVRQNLWAAPSLRCTNAASVPFPVYLSQLRRHYSHLFSWLLQRFASGCDRIATMLKPPPNVLRGDRREGSAQRIE